MKILVAGYDTRHIVSSGRRAGFEMYAIDHFCDADLREISSGCMKFDEKPDERELLKMIKSFRVDFDAVILNSGFERYRIPMKCLNDPIETRLLFTDKLLSNEIMESLGIPVPKVWEEQPEEKALLKPRFGGGGAGIREVSPEESIEPSEDFFFQEFIEGKPVSISFISDGSDFVIASVNEILAGMRELNQRNPFGYCGNITPFRDVNLEEVRRICRILVDNFSFIGTNGIDAILSERGLFVLEVNPRFQGSLDAVELSTGENLFLNHLRAFEGELGEFRNRRFASRLIYFSPETSVVLEIPRSHYITDVPAPGEVIEEGKPVASALGIGNSRESSLKKAWNRVMKIKENLKRL